MQQFNIENKQQALCATIAYFSLFQFPLKKQELSQWLLRYSLKEDDIVQLLERISSIEEKNGYVFFKEENKFISIREKNNRKIEKSCKKAYRFVPLLRLVPFVRGVSLCNNLPFWITQEQSDIDLFIVTSRDHLFLARFLVTMLFHILGVRRHGTKIKNRFCLSFYATEGNLDFSTIALTPQDIYLAYWTLGLTPIFGEKIYDRIVKENKSWLSEYFHKENIENNWNTKKRYIPYSSELWFQKFQEFLWKTSLGRWIETKLTAFQKKKIQKHYEQLEDTSGTIISDSMLKFHDRDRRKEYHDRWLQKIQNL